MAEPDLANPMWLKIHHQHVQGSTDSVAMVNGHFETNPDTLWNQTWTRINTETGVVANSSSSTKEPKDTWFPDFMWIFAIWWERLEILLTKNPSQ
ncbi:hypothetical protein HispidOSU_007902, partial [Sigmodon hispidus]